MVVYIQGYGAYTGAYIFPGSVEFIGYEPAERDEINSAILRMLHDENRLVDDDQFFDVFNSPSEKVRRIVTGWNDVVCNDLYNDLYRFCQDAVYELLQDLRCHRKNNGVFRPNLDAWNQARRRHQSLRARIHYIETHDKKSIRDTRKGVPQ